MRRVSIVGIGQVPVACDRADLESRRPAILAGEALAAARRDAGVPPQVVFLSARSDGSSDHIAGFEAAGVPVSWLPGCSGGLALHAAIKAVAGGELDVAAAAGAACSLLPQDAAQARTQAKTQALEYALIMRRYMYEYSWRSEHFGAFVSNACRNALGNNAAANARQISAEAYAQSPLLVDPMHELDAAGSGSGAACVIVCASDMAARLALKPVEVTASAVVADAPAFYDRSDILFPDGMADSAHAAYAQAGRSPGDIDLYEAYDAYSILAALSLETAGFAGKGYGVRLAQEGAITLTGKTPISTLGGLIGRGSVAEANAIYQAVEATLQLRGEAGTNQVASARCALVQAMSGDASCVATHILEA